MHSSIPLWSPSKAQIENSNLIAFMEFVSNQTGNSFSDYKQLYDWSINSIEQFWECIWKFSNILHSQSYNSILSERKMPGAKWFEGSKLNFAENLLRFNDDQIAIISARENFPTIKITYSELNLLVARCAFSLRKLGVKKGDRVCGYISNVPEAIIAMLSTTSIGAVWSSTSPDFGLQGVIDRFGQIKPKILFASESYFYNGKKIDCTQKTTQIVSQLPELEQLIIVPNFYDFNSKSSTRISDGSKNRNELFFPDLINNDESVIRFEQLPFDHPVYIMYSSGTTGVPKCIVHGAGGTLLQHFKELSLHTDLKRSDVINFFTTCGWMMWNWLVSSLQIGSKIFIYDGSPIYPNETVLWHKIEEEKVSVFGTSPKFISICEKSKLVPKDQFDLSSLRCVLSTGSPLSEDNFQWIYNNVKNDSQLSSISGGTDIISCFMLGNPIKPVYKGEIQTAGLGMKVLAFNDDGHPVSNEKGELVCTEPFPSMPIYFWNDTDNKKYLSAYFEKFPGVWCHGDYIEVTNSNGIIVYGRSDATLNPGGVRIGTSEIYRIVETISEISDSIVIGQNYENDVRVILFVVLKNDIILDVKLEQKIKSAIRNLATARHVPAKIFQVKEIPHTVNGKKVELAVTRLINGKSVDNKDALVNPHSLDEYLKIKKLFL